MERFLVLREFYSLNMLPGSILETDFIIGVARPCLSDNQGSYLMNQTDAIWGNGDPASIAQIAKKTPVSIVNKVSKKLLIIPIMESQGKSTQNIYMDFPRRDFS